MREQRCYKRCEKITIGAGRSSILIPGWDGMLIILSDMLYVHEGAQVWLEQEQVEGSRRVDNGDRLFFAGLCLTLYQEYIMIEGELEQCIFLLQPYPYKEVPFENFPYYKKSPRVNRKVHSESIDVKEPPGRASMSKGSLAQVIIPPICMAGVTIFMSIFMNRGLYVIASLCMTMVTLIFSIQRFFGERKEINRENEAREQVYSDYLVRLRAHIRRKRSLEQEILCYQAPPVEELERMALGYDSRLYERGMEEEDFLQVVLGYQAGKSRITVKYENDELRTEEDELQQDAVQLKEDFEQIDHIPLTVNLRFNHLGIIGEEKLVHNQLKYLLAQLCFFHSYHDLQIIFIGKESAAKEFAYLRWYPHLRIQAINVVANIYTDGMRDQVLGSILQMVKDRKQKAEESKSSMGFAPHLLFIIDEPRLIRDHAIMEYLRGQSGELGISIIHTSDQLAKLPENIKTVCRIDNSDTGSLVMEDGIRLDESFRVVDMEKIQVEQMSRAQAAVIHEKGVASRIPDGITFFDMYQIERPEELRIQKRWASHEAHNRWRYRSGSESRITM